MYGTAENVLPIVVPTILMDTISAGISMSYSLGSGVYGAGGQTRTGTRFPSPDFKSGMSTNSITPACNPRLGGTESIQRSLQLRNNHRTIALNTQVTSQIRYSLVNFSFIRNNDFQFLLKKYTLIFDAFTADLSVTRDYLKR